MKCNEVKKEAKIYKIHNVIYRGLVLPLLAGRALVAALVAHIEAPVAHLLARVEEQRGVGILALQPVGHACNNACEN